MIRFVMEAISCPQCHQLTNPQGRVCEHCGVELVLAALLAEHMLAVSSRKSRASQFIPLSPEVLVPRLGEYLIEQGFLTPEKLSLALEYQRGQEQKGEPRLIGQALLDLELISRVDLDLAVTEQILQLQSVIELANEQLEERVKERTRELENAMSKLTELNQLKSNFIANISHELRTPLTHIRGYLELLEDEALGKNSPEQFRALRVMLKSEARLEKLIEDLLQFSTFSSGGVDIRLKSINLNEIFSDIELLALQKTNDKAVLLRTSIPPDLPPVKADPQKLSWVILQLIDNAVKFTPEGGNVKLGARIFDSKVHIYIEDSGIGIEPEKIDEIFEPFHQLDSSSTRHHNGTGLGLAMLRKVIEAHNTEIKVRSKLDEGSCFEFSLAIVDQ
ncbi:MAG: ATP-binding protein [Chloroflexota bacterium]